MAKRTATGGYRKTGRRGNWNRNRRVVAKAKSMAVYATGAQASRVPRNYFSFLPNQFRIRLKTDYSADLNIAANQSNARFYYPLAAPIISQSGGATVRAAGGLLPLLYLYQRCYVKKAEIRMTIENMNPTPAVDVGTPGIEILTTSVRAVTSIMTDKQAADLVATGAITFDELRTTPGARNYFAQPFPAANYAFTDSQSVDIDKFVGGASLDHAQSTFASEGISTFTLQVPNAANRQNLPAYFFILERLQAAVVVRYRMTLQITYDCEFSNVRPLEQTSGSLFPWAPL